MSEKLRDIIAEQLTTNANGPGIYEVVVREGSAAELPKIYEESPVKLSGNIDAPLRWLQKRISQINPLLCYVEVNRDKLTMTLVVNERNQKFKDSITGSLSLDQAFIRVGINDDRYVTPKELSDRLRKNKAFFDTLQEATDVISKLQNFRARVGKIVDKIDDKRGNKVDHYEHAIQEINLPKEITFNIPVFKGQPKKVIKVDVEVKAEDLTVTLFSEDAYTVIDKTRDEAFNHQCAEIEAVLPGLPIIEI